MALEYKIGSSTYSISYRELKERYEMVCLMDDEEFRSKLPEILHLACVISFFKEIPSTAVLSDQGIIHLLAHQIHIPDDTKHEFRKLRDVFALVLKLD